MTVWRVTNHPVLDGGGGLRASSRWHTRGRRVVYCAPNPATALLEVMVHFEIDLEDIPVTLNYLEIEIPVSTSTEALAEDGLRSNWRSDIQITRNIGDEWLQSLRSAVLLVPCVLVPATSNVLINPLNPDSSRIRVARIHRQPIDARLLR